MFCKNCGNEIPDGATVCGYCGTSVTGTQGAGAGPYPGNGNPGQGMYKEAAPSYSGSAPNPNSGYPAGGYNPAGSNMDGGATGMAVTSMVLGIVALVVSCCTTWWLTVILAAISIVLGILALNKHTTGKGMAIAGIVCSAVSLVLMLIIIIVGTAFAAALFSHFSSY